MTSEIHKLIFTYRIAKCPHSTTLKYNIILRLYVLHLRLFVTVPSAITITEIIRLRPVMTQVTTSQRCVPTEIPLGVLRNNLALSDRQPSHLRITSHIDQAQFERERASEFTIHIPTRINTPLFRKIRVLGEKSCDICHWFLCRFNKSKLYNREHWVYIRMIWKWEK